MRLEIAIGDVPFQVHLERGADGRFKGHVDGEAFAATVEPLGGTRFLVTVDDHRIEVDVASPDAATLDDRRVAFRILAFDATSGQAGAGGADGTLRPPMPGAIARLLVREGQAVEKGVPLIVLEAMKMQNEIVAPFAGTVRKVHVKQGDTVTLQDVVLELERNGGA